MFQNSFKIYLILLVVIFVGCAKRGTITGGLKDTLAPVLKNGFPKNFSTNFKGNEIKLNFNEYVKLKNVTKQLIVSPPMKNALDISPSVASREIKIKIQDTLLPNTTYSFNFGNSIEDNNEGNPLKQFKYVFSTGNTIDSLKLKASVKDAFDKKVDNFISIMLYEVNEKYNDSIIFKEVPRYIANTLDSLKTVQIENLKSGKYRLIALKDVNGNNKFDPKTDKIGFQKEFVTIPNDNLFELNLFKQQPEFKVKKVAQISGNKLYVAYEGNEKEAKIEVKKGKDKIPFVVSKLAGKDTLQVWFKALKNDSLSINVKKDKFDKTFGLKIKDQKKDTLNLTYKSDLALRDNFVLESTIPLEKFDLTKMKLINKDSVAVKFTTEYDNLNQKLKFIFNREPLEKYKLTLLPKAIIDYYGKQNDTLICQFTTKNSSDYGSIRLTLQNVKRFPIIVELTNSAGKLIKSKYSEKETLLNFDLIDPEKVTVRLIYDDNKNGIWDAGNFIEQRQSEEVIYFPNELNVRSNWDLNEIFNVSK